MSAPYRYKIFWAPVAMLVAQLTLVSCSDRAPTLPSISAAKAAGGDPTVTATDPPGAPQDTTLDVHVFGTNFDRGSRADLALGGVVGPKVKTNSTRFVNSTELIANITISPTADTGKYDVIVTTSRGKKGIGTELFAIDVADPAIAFVQRGTSGNPDKLFVMNASGTHQTLIATGASFSFSHPSWSPDARSVAFAGTIGGVGGIWIIDVAVVNDVPTGSNLRQVPINLPGTSGGPRAPAWSPLGDLIAFMAGDTGTAYDRNIYVVPPTGGTATVVHTSASCCYPIHSDWSPDASKLVFSDAEIAAPYRNALKIVHRATAQVDTIISLTSGFFNRFPAWSRGGDRIAFSGGSDAEAVYTIPPLPNAPVTRIITGVAPAWSPNDAKLAFNGWQPGAVYSYEFSTGVRRKLASQAHTAPDWRRF